MPGVLDVTVWRAADSHAQAAWDISFRVRFASLEDAEVYGADPAHRAFVDEFLQPRVEVRKAWNFNSD